MKLRGTFTALITPFTRDGSQIDFPALKKLVEFQVEKGIHGLVPCGTTGESPTLSHAEHREVIAKVTEWAKAIRSDVTIIAGTGSNSTKEAVDLTKDAAKDGADYALVVNPYYNKPTQAGLEAHFTAIADASSIPLILYNIPGRTNVNVSIDTMKKLAAHENIAGVKEATGDLNSMTQVVLETPDDFTVLSGDDNLTLPLLSIGGDGVISVISNILPEQSANFTRLFHDGKYEEAKSIFLKLFPLCKAMFMETNPIPVKYAAHKMGFCENSLRLPMTSLNSSLHSEFEQTLISVMSNFGVSL